MKRGKLTQQIDSLRKEMNSSVTAQFIETVDVDKSKYMGKHIEGKRYISNEKQGYVLIKNVKSKQENVLFHATLDDEYAEFKERETAVSDANFFQRLEREPAKFQVLAEKNASRKRLMSDSSDDGYIKIPKSDEIREEASKDEVEFMSCSSNSEESDAEVYTKVPNEQINLGDGKQILENINENVNNTMECMHLSKHPASEDSAILLAEKKNAKDSSQHVTFSIQNEDLQTENILTNQIVEINERGATDKICVKESEEESVIERKSAKDILLETNKQSTIDGNNDITPTMPSSNLSTPFDYTNPILTPDDSFVDASSVTNASSDILSAVEMSTEMFPYRETLNDQQSGLDSSDIPLEVSFFIFSLTKDNHTRIFITL